MLYPPDRVIEQMLKPPDRLLILWLEMPPDFLEKTGKISEEGGYKIIGLANLD